MDRKMCVYVSIYNASVRVCLHGINYFTLEPVYNVCVAIKCNEGSMSAINIMIDSFRLIRLYPTTSTDEKHIIIIQQL